MSYLFGKFLDDSGSSLSSADAKLIAREARAKASHLAARPTREVLETLHAVGELWLPGSDYRREARASLSKELHFSATMLDHALEILPSLFQFDTLEKRLRAEFGDPAMLDRFVERTASRTRVSAIPHGVVLHVTAGNVFLGLVDSLVMALVTKNVSIVKLSSRNQTFPHLLARSIIQADPRGVISGAIALVHWKGGDESIEQAFCESVDAVLAWGGDEMARAYRRLLPTGTPLLEHGPKISFQVICGDALPRDGYAATANAIAHEVALWDQAACASPQNLFVDEAVDLEALFNALTEAFNSVALARGTLDADEQVEILKERERARLTSLTEDGRIAQGRDWLVHFDPQPGLRPSALNRTLIIKRFSKIADLRAQLAPYSRVLQSCSYLISKSKKDSMLLALAQIGVQRFAPLGRLLEGDAGAPHDGRFALHELVRFVGDEHSASHRIDILDFVNDAIRSVPFYRELYKGSLLKSVDELKPTSSGDFTREALPASRALLREDAEGGMVFSSGGTTGHPKYAFFTHDEFDRVGTLLAKGYAAQGVRRGNMVANLFVAGNMWSSFMAVDRALAKLGTVILPIGGTANPDFILDTLEQFKPRVVFGLPSLIVALAQRSEDLGRKICVPVICYAGEHLNRQARELLSRVWRTERCFSAGYASVDAGPIGYQCPFLADREHHLFADDVHLDIIDGEGYVTSTVRQSMPVIHLRTGDHLEWTSKNTNACACGAQDPRFVLHGRVDGQINLWASRIQLEEIEAGLYASGVIEPVYQVRVHDDSLSIAIEGDAPPKAPVARSIYEACKDLKSTHSFAALETKIVIGAVPRGSLERIARTGKVRTVLDTRKL